MGIAQDVIKAANGTKASFVQNIIDAAKGTKQFVAFVFLTFTAGMVFALYIINVAPLLLFAPPLLGFVAFYDKKIAYILLVGMLVFIFL